MSKPHDTSPGKELSGPGSTLNNAKLQEKMDLADGFQGKSLITIGQFTAAPEQIENLLNEAKSLSS